ncbi:MAG: dTDP-glucose 4,6-dehydratase [Candidatus Thermoplasmatota archaeon]|nr:dTDP-glucose 4,6-dehydratase [Candidatus Thermoplasmatota archaeon]MCL5731429.1 dTDP-glucose 4,6-dehydratase [Candidatus Thermoplasmatota archaeon]
MKLVITGGFGFIGSNFINMLAEDGTDMEIVNIDKVTYAADPENIKEDTGKAKITNIIKDICDLSPSDECFKDADVIVNFAAESHVDRSINDSSSFIRSNIVGVHNLLEICRKKDIRFHQISTDEVYGSLSLDSDEKFGENTPYRPRNPYSATKASADFLVRSYYNTYGIRATISNCSNNYGPNQHPEKLIPKTILLARENKKIPVYGNGKQIRDWIHVSDHCNAVKLILENGRPGETYLIGADGEATNLDVIHQILKIMRKPESIIEFVADRPGHDVRYAIDSSKIRKELGWRPKVDFNVGLKNTVDHYLANSGRYMRKIST